MRTTGGLTKKNTEIAQAKQATMQGYVKAMGKEIAKALPSVLTPERFTRMVFTALSTNPKLQQCTPNSFLGAMMQAAQLGVEPNTPIGQAYLIPYKNKGTLECQFQLGYKGLIDLCNRSGDIKDIQAHEVYENDLFEYEYGLEPKLKHVPAMKDRGEVIAYYAVFHTVNGGYGFEVMGRDDVINHAQKTSQSYGSGFSPWTKYFDEMAKKTVVKKVLKFAPIKTEFFKALSTDETIKTNITEHMEDMPDETIIDVEAKEIVDDDIPANVDKETGEVKE
ncbi:recombinase RecT [Dialister micraerophilus]|uniref:Recombinase, phage RecT family n=1 Tax=Dialister micraerophilus UPII 345-E TaxID=910314 RepID=E4L8C5_9FIRM|nr:recombinase RecT [Dialister micraerophilus]EFR43057.1 recombinase, phage RecT family [Dialister micraerophilus UPII 345-E]